MFRLFHIICLYFKYYLKNVFNNIQCIKNKLLPIHVVPIAKHRNAKYLNMNDDYPMTSIQEFPNEVLMHIFSHSSPQELSCCSQVCSRWKEIVDRVLKNDNYWHRHCIKEFGELAETAYNKSQSGSTWRRIYRCLTLWPKVDRSQESRDEFAVVTSEGDEIYGFQVLQKGVVGVHRQKSIVYYYVKDLQPVDVPIRTGCYLKYMENEDTLVFQSIYFHLFVVRKYVLQKHFRHNTTFDDVKQFKLVNRLLYFVRWNDDLCVCDLNNSDFLSHYLCTIPDGMLTFTVYKKNVYILTKRCNIHVYDVDKSKLTIFINFKNANNPFNTLRRYRFLDELDNNVNFLWLNHKAFHSVPNKFKRDITSIKTYGDIVFVGTKYGVFRIYHIKSNEDLSFVDKKLIKEYNFKTKGELSVRIHQIDVVEGDDQHTVLVALENKIIALNFTHKFE